MSVVLLALLSDPTATEGGVSPESVSMRGEYVRRRQHAQAGGVEHARWLACISHPFVRLVT
jgi:hypothetical protein